jgi:hypothetical protein
VGSWASIEASVLTPRAALSAAWVGDHVVVWGGENLDPNAVYPGELNDGALFNPVTGEWEALEPTGYRRQGADIFGFGNEFVVFGGMIRANLNGPYPVLQGFRKDLTSGQEKSIDGPIGVSYFGRSTLIDGDYVLWGNASQLCRYSLTSSVWTCEDMQEFVDGPPGGWPINDASAWMGNEFVSWGGLDSDGKEMATGWRLDIESRTWTPMSTVGAPEARVVPLLRWLDDRLLVAGGTRMDGTVLDSGGFYDPATDTWTGMTPTSGFSMSSAVVRAGDRVLFWDHQAATGGVYDFEKGTWTPVCTTNGMPEGNLGASATWTGSSLVVLGGAKSDTRIGAQLTL